MSDYLDSEGLTPLMRARKPAIDWLAKRGAVGLCQTIPAGMIPGSDTANLSVLGYDPRVYYTGRSPLEAASMGIPLLDTDVTYRCNLVSLSGAGALSTRTMRDYSAGDISTDEARELIEHLAKNLPLQPRYRLYAGVGYRHCLVDSAGVLPDGAMTAPHDITDKPIAEFLPKGGDLLRFTEAAVELLRGHPINERRRAKGQNPADSVWFWGAGRKAVLPDFTDKTGKRGAVISAVDLIRGIGSSAGMTVRDVAGATGNIHTDFEGKAAAALDMLRSHDFVFVHVEAADECGHHKDLPGKVLAIQYLSERLIKRLIEGLKGGDYAILVLPDHGTPVSLGTHVSDPVPYLCYDSRRVRNNPHPYDERGAEKGRLIPQGHELLTEFFKDTLV